MQQKHTNTRTLEHKNTFYFVISATLPTGRQEAGI